jgi:hypothetical protein
MSELGKAVPLEGEPITAFCATNDIATRNTCRQNATSAGDGGILKTKLMGHCAYERWLACQHGDNERSVAE